MERFVNIDWNPPLEDMLDNVFINEARLEKESVMYRIMNGNFTDPFKNADEDYKNVKINFIKNIDPELNEENKDNEIATSETKKENQSKQKKNVRCYVPGIVKPIFKFPKKSKLNTVQHAMCLRVLLRFSETGKPKLTQTEKEELHNYLVLENNVRRLLMLIPKLEYQVDLGAEAVTLQESLKQWISLIFRPHTFIARVRISAITSEVLQVEYRTAMSISNEIKRLYNIKVESSLTIIHNIIQYLQNLAPGRYILRHTVRNGAFATVYKETDSPGKNTFDLHTIYGKEFYNLPNSAWIPLDKTIPTPMHKCFERMPAMFFPSNYKTFNKNQKASEINKANIGPVRRSLRNKIKK